MVQPSWFNQTFGWDTITSPFAGPTKTNNAVYIENAYALLSSPGQWYQDIAAGVLYYIPLSGQDITKVDVELPQVEALLVVAGSSYDQKAQNLTFSGLTFSHTSWLNPNTSDGYACQQTNTYIHGDGKPRSRRTVGQRTSSLADRTGRRCRAPSRCQSRRTSPSCATVSSIWGA